MRPSPRLIALALTLAAVTVMLALALGQPAVWAVALWSCALGIVGADAAFSIPRRRIGAVVTLPQAGMVGVALLATVTIRASKASLPRSIDLRFDIDAALGTGDLPPLVCHGAEATFKTELFTSLRGVFSARALHVKWRSRWGFLEILARFAIDQQVTIAPDIGPVLSGQIQAQMLPLLDGQKDMRFKGSGSDFHQLRDFAAGMDHRQIDWKRSARLQNLVARETRAEKNHQILMAVDCGYLMREKIDGLPKLDRAINGALSLGWAAALGGDHVGLYAFDSRPRQFLLPLPGRASFPRLQAMAAAMNYTNFETNHTLGLTHLLSRLKRRGLIIVFSDFIDSITAALLVENTALLARHHLVLFVALRDPDLSRIASPESYDLNSIAASVSARQILRERQAVLDQLHRSGVLILDVEPQALTSALVSRYIEIKAGELI